jgi:glycosyltransferase involved in cell wall biosynthesis
VTGKSTLSLAHQLLGFDPAEGTHPVDVSIVICTYNRSRLLRAALTHLLAQRAGSLEIEIIVVDNNSSDDTAEVVRQVANGPQGELRYSFEASQGISYARNAGLALTHGSIVAFTDDDIEVEPDWVARIVAAFAAHPDIDCVGGKVLPSWPVQPPAWLTRDHWTPLAILDYGDAPLTLDRNDPRCLIGANVAFRRDVIDRLGGFSPAVQRVKDGIGSIEDYELLTRLWNAGGRARYVPEIVVVAPVDPARLHKRYHRRWHFGHGHFHALMRAPNLEESAAGRLLDVPAHLYRQYLIDAVVWLLLVLTGHLDRAFVNETRMRFFWGFFETRRRQYLAHASHSAIGKIGALARALHRQIRVPVVRGGSSSRPAQSVSRLPASHRRVAVPGGADGGQGPSTTRDQAPRTEARDDSARATPTLKNARRGGLS